MSANRGKAALFDDANFEINKGILKKQDAQDTPDTHSVQNTHDTQSAQGALKTQQSQRKQKHPRINMAFYGDNLNYLRDAAWKAKMSVTEYVNTLISQDKEKKNK